MIKKTLVVLCMLMAASPALIAKKKPVQPTDRAVFHNNQGVSYLNKGEMERAEFEFKTAVELSPEYAEAVNNLGVLFKMKGQYTEAEKYFKRAIYIDKGYSSAYNHLGTVYLAQGQIEDAIKMIEKAIKKEPAFADAYYNLGICYIEKTKKNPSHSYVKFAEHYFKKATELNPNLKLVHTELAKMYRELGDYEHAVIRYRLALENDPGDIDTWLKLGSLSLQMKEPFKAQNTFLKAVELNPSSAEAHQQLALFYYNEGRYDDSMNEFTEVTRLNPLSEVAHFRIGTIKLHLGDGKKESGDAGLAQEYYAQAAGELQKALHINPTFVDASYNLGLAQLRLNNKDAARKQWELTLVTSPLHPQTLYNLGQLYGYTGRKKESLELLCKFISLQIKEYAGEIETARKIVASEGGCP